MASIIPDECKLNLWAKVIVAKNTLADEPILGTFDEYGEPLPDTIIVPVAEKETVECIDDFKIILDPSDITKQFICNSKVIITIPFTAHFWIKTNQGFTNISTAFTFIKEIPVSEFIKSDSTVLTPDEFRNDVEQSDAVAGNYEIAYINVLPKTEPTVQTIQIILTATVINRLGKYKDVMVYGYKEELNSSDFKEYR